jgi:hypothetical protein
MTWTWAGNVRTLRPNKNLSFCPGAIIDGVPQPFVVGTRAKHTFLCQNLLLSIANPRMHHSALHSGSDSHKECGLHTFPKSVLHQSVAAHGIQWPYPFTLPLRPHRGTHPRPHPLGQQSLRTSQSGSELTGPPSTEAPLMPRWHPSQRQPRTMSMNPTLGTTHTNLSSLKFWMRSFLTTKNS